MTDVLHSEKVRIRAALLAIAAEVAPRVKPRPSDRDFHLSFLFRRHSYAATLRTAQELVERVAAIPGMKVGVFMETTGDHPLQFVHPAAGVMISVGRRGVELFMFERWH